MLVSEIMGLIKKPISIMKINRMKKQQNLNKMTGDFFSGSVFFIARRICNTVSTEQGREILSLNVLQLRLRTLVVLVPFVLLPFL